MSDGRIASPSRFVFWQPIESPHQRDFLEAIAKVFPGEVVLAAERRLPAERVAQGWPAALHDRVQVVDASDPAVFRELVGHDTSDTLHVFSGFFSHRVVWRAFRRLAPTAARRAVLTEAPDLGFPAGLLKRLRGRFLLSRFGERIEFVLAMGSLGRQFMEGVGVPRDRIVTFGYRLAVPQVPWPQAPVPLPGAVRFVAAGQFILRKGFDRLIDAFADISRDGWSCDIYGDGPMRESLSRRIVRRKLSDRVHLNMTVDNLALRREIAAADWTVVPSRHDGWGMLVNESMIAGTPVVCTNRCGAADLVVNADVGHVVPAADRATFASVLQKCVAGGRIDGERRGRIHAIASQHGVDEIVRAFLHRVDGVG